MRSRWAVIAIMSPSVKHQVFVYEQSDGTELTTSTMPL